MTLRKYTRAAGIGAFVFSGWASALGLGEIKLNSALDEPFDAEIKLLNLGDLSEQEILAGLAPAQDFIRAGVEREFILTGLNFGLDLTSPGGPVIRVTSKQPIREPYLDFLIEVQWTSGRLLREYTVLLDLPVFAGGQSGGKPVAAAQVSKPEPASTSSAPTAASVPSRPAPASKGPAFNPGEKYKVQSGDTLWKIASKIPSRSTSVQQRMKAVHNLNPDAFINDDINLLKSGHILRLPAYEDIDAINHSDAVADISRQTVSASDSAAQLSASQREKRAMAPEPASEGRLQLSAVDTDFPASSASSTSGANSGAGGSGSLQNDIAMVQEELDRTQRENSDLKKRLGNLEDQLSTMQRMLELRSDEFRATQLVAGSDLTDENPEQLTALQPAAGSDPEESDLASAEAASTGDAALPSQTDESSPLASTPVAPAKAGVATQPAAAKPDGFFQVVADYLYYILGGVLALLALLVAKVMSGKKENAADEAMMADLGRQVEQEADLFCEEEVDVASAADDLGLKDSDNLFASSAEDAHPDLELSDEEEVDPAGEAEIYLSIGNYDEARDVLLEAIAKDPENAELHLKLLEVYAAGDEGEAFARHFPKLAAFNMAALTNRAEALRQGLSGSFAESDESGELDNIEDMETDVESGYSEDTSDIDELFASLDAESGLDDEDLDKDSTEAELAEFDLGGADLLEGLDEIELDAETTAEQETETDDLADTDLSEIDLSEEDELLTDTLNETGDRDAEDLADLVEEETLGSDGEVIAASDVKESDIISPETSSERIAAAEEEAAKLLGNEKSDLDFDLDLDIDNLDFSEGDDATEHTAADLESQLEEQDLVSDLDEFEDIPLREPEDQSNRAGGTSGKAGSADIEDIDLEGLDAELAETDLDLETGLDLNDDFDMLGDTDEAETQLQLAQAYIDMGDPAGARDILTEVAECGTDDQKDKAKELLEALS